MKSNTNFISVKERLPEIGKLVWLYNSQYKAVFLGVREMIYDDWMWGISFGNLRIIDGKITADFHIDSDYEFDYWAEVPELPED